MIGIGIDIASIKRVETFVNRFGKKGLYRFLSKKELKLASRIETIAGFWATKEAVSKALGCGIGKELGFLDIKISKTKKNAPKVKLTKRARKRHKVEEVVVSISHESGIAIAVAEIIKKGKR